MTSYKLAPYAKLIIYKKDYTPEFVSKIIQEDNFEGLRVFAHLPNERLENLDFLKEYSFLERLDISTIVENDFNYDFLNSLQNLKHLSLSICVLNKKSINPIPLSGLANLKSFGIGHNQKFNGIENCRNIESLFLGDFQQPNLKIISCLSNLKTLCIKQSTINNLDGIDSCRFLESVLFGHCKRLTNISALDRSPNLLKLTFDGCSKIKTLNHLTQMSKLEILEIIDCKEIDSLSFLNSMPTLQNLKFGGTIIFDNNLIPAQKIKSVFYQHKKQYNIKLDTNQQDDIHKRNMQKLKDLGYIK